MRTDFFSNILIAAVLLASALLSGFQPRPLLAGHTNDRTNPAAFSFKGLRLYMSPEEAAATMDSINRNLSPDSFQFYRSNPRLVAETAQCLQERLRQIKELLFATPNSCIVSMSWDSTDQWLHTDERYAVTLDFAEALPNFPNAMRLWHIEYNQGAIRTADDAGVILSALVQKYGPPTTGSIKNGSICYATEIGAQGQCGGNDQKSPYMTVTKSRWVDGHYSLRIDIYDRALQARSIKEKQAALYPPIGKPAF